MDDLSVHLKAITKYTLVFLVICGIGWLILPQYRGYTLGFGLGIAVGMINAYYLAAKIIQVAGQAELKQKKRGHMGFLTRASIAVLVALLAIKNDNIEVFTFVLALIVVPIVALVAGYNAARKSK